MARDTNRSGRSSRRGRSSAPVEANASPAGGVDDLARFVGPAGVSEERISETTATARAVSDAQAGEGTPPPVPTPAPLDSPAELNVASAAAALAAERDRWRARTRRVVDIARSRPTPLQGIRDAFWTWELVVLSGQPRISYVGRAIFRRTEGTASGIGYIGIFTAINEANSSLLPETVRLALPIAEHGSTASDPDEKTTQQRKATSTLSKNLNCRIEVLTRRSLQYAVVLQTSRGKHYRLTPSGEQVFNNWPNWHAPDAIPVESAGETDAEEADAGPAPPTD